MATASPSSTLSGITTRDLIVVHWNEKLDAAYRLLTESGVRHLPVVDDDGSVVGIVSERDFDRAMRAGEYPGAMGEKPAAEFDSTMRVFDYMSWPIEAIEESSSIADAARRMVDFKISSLLVVSGSRLVGIVTTEDILRSIFGDDATTSDLEERATEVGAEMRAALYTSPVGPIAQVLANAGI